MARVLRPNYAQRFLLPPSLDDWVPKTHPARFVRDFVDSLDLAELDMEQEVADEGRPPYAVDLVLKVWLFGYMERIRSPRALEKACLGVIPFLWLTGNLHPDHNTLWRFFKLHRKGLPKLFKKLVKTAAAADLVGFVLHAIDGTKLTAASSTDEAHHRKSLEEKLKRLDEFIAAYMQEVTRRAEEEEGQGYAMPAALADDAARLAKIRALLERRLEDREDEQLLAEKKTGEGEPQPQPDASPSTTTDEPKPATTDAAKPPPDDEPPPGGGGGAGVQSSQGSTEPPADPLLREAEALKKEIADTLTTLDEAGVSHLNEGEPEARMMKGRGTHALGYNAQIVVDHDSDLIVACDVVTDQNDLTQLLPMLEQVHETLGRVAQNSVGDAGYANGDQLRDTEARGMSVIVGLRDEPDAKGEYSKAYFRYDAESNVYICPKGERLVQIGTNKSHATTQHADVLYRCHNKTCPVRAACTKNPRGRQIRRTYGEEDRERQAQKQQDPRMRVLLSLRKEIVEHLFGIVKAVDGFRRFTVRGLEKVSAQWALVCTAVNLRKLYVWWRQGKLTFGSPTAPTPGPSAAAAAT
jgi:transposase